MSSDEAFVEATLTALHDCGIDAIVIGSVAALLQGVPITTEGMDVLVRDTPRNRAKLKQLEAALGHRAIQVSPLTRTLRISTAHAHLDILFDEISGGQSFQSLSASSVKIPLGTAVAVVAPLESVIASKQAAGRPKDVAQLPILRDTLRVRQALERDGETRDR